MSPVDGATVPIGRTDRFFIGGQWVAPSSGATIDVIDSATEELYFRVAEAQAADIIGGTAQQFDDFIKSELKRWPEVVKAAGITAQ